MSLLQKVSLMPWSPSLVNVGQVSSAWDPALLVEEALNVIPDSRGFLRSRGGFRPLLEFNSPATRGVAGLACGRFSSEASTEFMAFSLDIAGGSDLTRYQNHYILLEGSRVAIPIGGDTPTFGTVPDYQVVGNLLVITLDGAPPIGYWFGVGASAAGNLRGVPSGAIAAKHKYRLVIGRIATAPTHIRWSVPGSPLDFDGESAGYQDVSERSGDVVTAIIPEFYGSMYVMTRHSICTIDMDSNTKRTLNTALGGYQQTVQNTGNDVLYASSKGLHSLVTTDRYGDVESTFLSAPVAEFWKRVDTRAWHRAWSAYWPEEDIYWICLPTRRGGYLTGQGLNDQTFLAYHVGRKQWSQISWPALCCAYTQKMSGTGKPGILAAGANSAGLYRIGWIDGGDRVDYEQKIHGLTQPEIHDQSLGTPFDSVITTIPITCGDPDVVKSFRQIKVWFDSSCADHMSVEWLIDDKWDEETTPGIEQQKWRSAIGSVTSQFWMNPNNENVLVSNKDDAGTELSGPGFYLAGIHKNVSYATIPLEGRGTQIRLRFRSSSRKFAFYGVDLYYLPETTQVSWGRREDRLPVETPIVYSRPAPEVIAPQGDTDASEI